jgi:hypothetical protein
MCSLAVSRRHVDVVVAVQEARARGSTLFPVAAFVPSLQSPSLPARGCIISPGYVVFSIYISLHNTWIQQRLQHTCSIKIGPGHCSEHDPLLSFAAATPAGSRSGGFRSSSTSCATRRPTPALSAYPPPPPPARTCQHAPHHPRTREARTVRMHDLRAADVLGRDAEAARAAGPEADDVAHDRQRVRGRRDARVELVRALADVRAELRFRVWLATGGASVSAMERGGRAARRTGRWAP